MQVRGKYVKIVRIRELPLYPKIFIMETVFRFGLMGGSWQKCVFRLKDFVLFQD